MTKVAIILFAAFSMPSAAMAQSYYRAPPIEVEAQRPPYYYAPQLSPFVAIGNTIGGIVAIPFQLITGLGSAMFGAQPQVAIIPDGMGGLIPSNNSPYDSGTGQFMPPHPQEQPQFMPSGPYPSITPTPEPAPSYYAPQPHVHHAPRHPEPRGCYGPTGAFVGDGNPECSG